MPNLDHFQYNLNYKCEIDFINVWELNIFNDTYLLLWELIVSIICIIRNRFSIYSTKDNLEDKNEYKRVALT